MQTGAIGTEIEAVRTAGGTVWQALAHNFQSFTVFFEIDAAQVRGNRTVITVDLFVGFLGTPNHHFLVMNAHAVKLLQVMFPTLHKHIATASIHAIFNNRDFTARFNACRVFRTVNKAAEIALFNPTETVDLFFDFNTVAKGFHCRLCNGEIHVMTQRENMNQHIILGSWRKTFTVRDKVF